MRSSLQKIWRWIPILVATYSIQYKNELIVVFQVFVKLLSSKHLVIVFSFSKKGPATRWALKAKLLIGNLDL